MVILHPGQRVPAKRARDALALLPAHATPGECFNQTTAVMRWLAGKMTRTVPVIEGVPYHSE
jgi:hypothetical protein